MQCRINQRLATGTAKQLGGGPVADVLMSLHKLTGALTLLVVVMRLIYGQREPCRNGSCSRTVIRSCMDALRRGGPGSAAGLGRHFGFGRAGNLSRLFAAANLAGGRGYDGPLLKWHAYFAFALLALVALHIGVAIQDYMTDRHLDDN